MTCQDGLAALVGIPSIPYIFRILIALEFRSFWCRVS
jgi:hypothetical protein